MRSRTYNRIAWSTAPADYAAFAAAAIASGDGPLLEVAAGSAAATAELHAGSPRPTVLVDLPALVAGLRSQLVPDGQLHLAGLVAETRRGRRYLEVLHRAGEVAAPRTAEQLHVALGRPTDFRTTGCMAYATLPAV